ncbi:hypothetical protein Tco_1575784 [Tanacetum coccineum]
MPYSWFTKLIVKYILSQNEQISKRPLSFNHVIKLDATLSNLKVANKGTKDLVFGIPISELMLNNKIKISNDYSLYLEKSKASEPVKATGRGKILLNKEGVEIAFQRVSIHKRRRSKNVVKEVWQSEEVAKDVDFEETDEEPPV